jgi:predicted dehydrogenase
MPTYNMVKKLIDNKELGEVNDFITHLFVAQVFHQGKGWLYDPEMSGGGVLMDLGSHAIDMIHYLIGDIKQVTASGKSIYNKKVEDYVYVDFKLDNNIFGTLETSWSMENYRLPELYFEIHLDKGTIITTEKYVKIFSEEDTNSVKKGWNSFYKQQLTKNIPINLGGSEYTLEDLHFLNCIKNNEKSQCDFYEAAKTNNVIDKIYISMEKNTEESIEYGV